MRLRTTALLTTTLTAAALVPLASPTTATAAPSAPAKFGDDFNGDGYRDYATAEYGESKGGAVRVTFGTPSGPGREYQIIHQGSPGIPGADETGDRWGEEVRVAADFNRDGYGDLAVAAPTERVGRDSNQGGATVLWGSPDGLSRGTAIPNKAPKAHHWFGSDLATGDFNGDGTPDLAAVNGRSVHVYTGGISPSGVGRSVVRLTKGNRFTPQTLIAGRVTKDAATDLVIAGEGVTASAERSDAWFIKGGSTLRPGSTLRVSPYSPSDTEGVVADFDKDGYGDIAVSAPQDSRHSRSAGAVTVWRGGSSGPGSATRLTQATSGIAGTPEKSDWFGSDISAGDVNGDGYQDLAIGVRGETVDGKAKAGGVHVLRGGRGGLKGTGSQWFARNTRGVPGALTEWDVFGRTVRLRDTDRDGYADLYVNGDQDDVRLLGSPSGVTTTGARSLGRDDLTSGILQ
ncbi:FG-GAP and VCBS repeat-containing protein [Streptomyces sp. NPDC127108]|uniref:FG-GAP and VCBS repeat-containing protein n=1 Tax=Streptomyces sp. NPDC127108 TaxID=3345361 RepID=UPI00362B6834